MKKKTYNKPEIEIVDLRVEERLATCQEIWFSSYGYQGCNDIQWQNSDPDNCSTFINENS